MMTRLGLELLVSDPATRVIVLISKPPAARVMEALDAIVHAIDKPVVVCCLGGARPTGAPGHPVSTLHEAAAVAAALARGQSPAPEPLSPLALARSRLLASATDLPRGKHLLGLYSGGTLAHEARLTLEPLLGPIGSESADRAQAGHQILDLGADQFTRARPHPMIDATERAARMREAGRRADVGVVLLDLVLGRGAHHDPAGALAPAIRGARETAAADGRSLAIVASVVGTAGDPQGLAAQTAALESAGVQVLPSNPDACGLAALLVKPELERSVLGAAP
jgi:succinyl-CoA synthetase alpha subunit